MPSEQLQQLRELVLGEMVEAFRQSTPWTPESPLHLRQGHRQPSHSRAISPSYVAFVHCSPILDRHLECSTAHRFRLAPLHDVDVQLVPECLGAQDEDIFIYGAIIVAVCRPVCWVMDALLPSATDSDGPTS